MNVGRPTTEDEAERGIDHLIEIEWSVRIVGAPPHVERTENTVDMQRETDAGATTEFRIGANEHLLVEHLTAVERAVAAHSPQ